MKTPLFLSGKYVGDIDEEKKCYISFRDDSHFFRKYNGFGVSESVLDKLFEEKVKFIVINYKNLKGYWTEIDSFIVKAKEYNDNGDKQLILPLEFWKQSMNEIKVEAQAKL